MPKPKNFNSSVFFGNLLDDFEEGFGFPNPRWGSGSKGRICSFFVGFVIRRSSSSFFQNDATGPSLGPSLGFFELEGFFLRVDGLSSAETGSLEEEELSVRQVLPLMCSL